MFKPLIIQVSQNLNFFVILTLNKTEIFPGKLIFSTCGDCLISFFLLAQTVEGLQQLKGCLLNGF